MKRLIIVIAVLALLVAGTVSVLADPINVGGGTLTQSTFAPIHVGGGTLTAFTKAPGHAYGLYKKQIVEPEEAFLSPIVIGGGT